MRRPEHRVPPKKNRHEELEDANVVIAASQVGELMNEQGRPFFVFEAFPEFQRNDQPGAVHPTAHSMGESRPWIENNERRPFDSQTVLASSASPALGRRPVPAATREVVTEIARSGGRDGPAVVRLPASQIVAKSGIECAASHAGATATADKIRSPSEHPLDRGRSPGVNRGGQVVAGKGPLEQLLSRPDHRCFELFEDHNRREASFLRIADRHALGPRNRNLVQGGERAA